MASLEHGRKAHRPRAGSWAARPAALGALVVLLLTLPACGSPPLVEGPNVVFITLDTLRLDRLSCYGGPAGNSPHIDALAAAGVRFESVLSPRGLTWPSLTTLLTGLHPRTHQVRVNGDMLDEKFETVPEVLQAAGYSTGGFLANMCDAPNRGLDVFFCAWWEDKGPPPKNKPHQWASHDQVKWDAAVTRKGIEFIKAESGRPFFAWLHYIDPHRPYDAVDTYLRPEGDASFQVDDDSLNERTLSRKPLEDDERQRLMAVYDSQVAAIDAQIGQVLQTLKDEGLADDTLVILSADHGEELGDHQTYFYHRASMYDQVLAIPLILHWPGELPAGVTVDELVAAVDVAPTLLDLTGLPAPDGNEGESRAPLARQEAGARGAAVTYSEWADQLLIIGEGSWRYIWNPNAIDTHGVPLVKDRGFAVSPEELYDLSADPRQMTNIVAEHPERAAAMREKACDFLTEKSFRRQSKRINEDVKRRLKKLGYAGEEDEGSKTSLISHCPSPGTAAAR